MFHVLDELLVLSGLKKVWPLLSEEEVRQHNTRRSLWIVSGNSVYDVTDVLGSHPGGEAAILRRGGGSKDCEADYEFHSRYARREWDGRKVGEVTAEVAARLFPMRGTGQGADAAARRSRAGAPAPSTRGISRTHGAVHEESRTRTVDTYASTTVTPDQHFRYVGYQPYLQEVH